MDTDYGGGNVPARLFDSRGSGWGISIRQPDAGIGLIPLFGEECSVEAVPDCAWNDYQVMSQPLFVRVGGKRRWMVAGEVVIVYR